MKRLICVVIVVIELFLSTNLNSSYMDKPYVVDYPVVIMRVPGYVKYIMKEPCGEIKAVYIEKEATNE